MRKWLTLLIFALLLALPSLAAAQTGTRLASLEVKLWPEYDQPSMLVIYDFQVAEGLSLPARLEFHLPAEARLNAVAALQNGKFLNTPSEGPVVQGEWQVLTIPVSTAAAYRIEFYQPLGISGSQRQFSFLWYGDHTVDAFRVSLQQPVDASNMTTDPPLEPVQESDGLTYYNTAILNLQQGEQFSLNLGYEKSSDRLTVPSNDIQPSAPVDENTAGRVSVSNYIPYILGALGVILLVGGLGYNFLWRKPKPASGGRRRRVRAQPTEEPESEVYCHQCGQRARTGDRFCRVCGTRLRLPPEG